MPSPAPPVTPGTPSGATQTPNSAASTPATGTWRHPRFDEIARRQQKATFSDRNVNRIVWNTGALLASFVLMAALRALAEHFPPPDILIKTSNYCVLTLRVLLLFNIGAALLPLFRRPDDFADIPLTPSQRALLGLNPNASPASTPGSHFITPPRYPRTSTSLSGTPGTPSPAQSASPQSNQPASLLGGLRSGSPFSPSASPLLQKAIGAGNKDATRRRSYGSASPLGNGSPLGNPSTPTPSNKGASVALNSRWLYKRAEGSSSSQNLFS